MLLCILTIYSYIGSTDFNIISLYDISLDTQKILWLGFFLAFAVKTPLYPFIIWLPKAHGRFSFSWFYYSGCNYLKISYLRLFKSIN